MDQFWGLALFSMAMFFGCYTAGSIPLLFSLSEKALRKFTVLGAGLLVGTALIVIIPEGIEALFSGSTPGQPHHSHKGSEQDVIVPGTLQEQPKQNDNKEKEPLKLLEDGWFEANEKGILQFLLGFSLVLGFVFMLVIDQLSETHSHSATDTNTKRGGMTATIGLVVHAAADGLALGAAAGLSKTEVEMIIFLAIMLHKAPAAFGFVSFLIHEGYDKRRARWHLLLFSSAAPVFAFISYFGLVRVMYISPIPFTGVTMLFSAGTFLYVATVHVLNDITHSSSSSKLSRSEIIILVSGAFLPLVFNFIHSH
jgi:zinc transporter 9